MRSIASPIVWRRSWDVRAVNFYCDGRDERRMARRSEENHLARCWAEEAGRRAGRRRRGRRAFNHTSPILRRGLGLFPLKFGISFNLPHLNQGPAPWCIVYTDGSIRLNHGGIEMGQGLFIKVAQVVAEVFKVGSTGIRPSATSTAEVPNTSPTAASTGSDLNGWAAWEAANTIKQRMVAFAAEHFGSAPGDIEFADGTVRVSFGPAATRC